ncbi:MAG TPA: hypothetical protein PLM07_21535 [Candidatus Rifleibacterium sp.]|nr:hypothetical protein [Candidatus Rifleibacterium sp.]HPT48476.1 hypothetical protein [Candidatus Rifleibacterium sp.]
MRVEINVSDNQARDAENSPSESTAEAAAGAVSCDVAIDIGQVLAANQALLKNMARKMEAMESKLNTMERVFNEHAARIAEDRQTVLLLTGPVKEVKPWEPPTREPDEEHFRKFSLVDRLFRPWRMRRQ